MSEERTEMDRQSSAVCGCVPVRGVDEGAEIPVNQRSLTQRTQSCFSHSTNLELLKPFYIEIYVYLNVNEFQVN